MARTRHTRTESRLAVYRVLLDIFEARQGKKKISVASLCSKHHCGNINGDIIREFDFSKMPELTGAVNVLKANSQYKRGCNKGTRKSAKQVLAETYSDTLDVFSDEAREAEKMKLELREKLAGADLNPDNTVLFPEESLLPKAIDICRRAGLIVSRPLL